MELSAEGGVILHCRWPVTVCHPLSDCSCGLEQASAVCTSAPTCRVTRHAAMDIRPTYVGEYATADSAPTSTRFVCTVRNTEQSVDVSLARKSEKLMTGDRHLMH